ncbi:MAG: ATP-binding protein [Muribaculaceae bacterium]|nr:ATP-binding protein [Muribaculaceae bacterium]
MKALNNPFVTYGYKGPEYFCDREQETKSIITALHNERNITLVAPRRMGKTGLIHHVLNKIEQTQPDVRCFYVDIFPTKNLQQMVQAMARAILGKLDSPSQTAMRKVTQFFGRFRPTVTYDEITGTPTVSLDIAPNEERNTLKQIFEYMHQSGVRCYVAIDEFQQILQYSDTGIEALIRSYIQFLPNVYFIFAGSQHHVLEQMFSSVNRPFFQSTQMMHLGPLDESKYRQFANDFFKVQNREISTKLFHQLYETMHGVTWYVHAVLNRVYQEAEKSITQKLIDQVMRELVEEQSPVFQNYYNAMTVNQAAVAVAIAREQKVAKPLSQDFIARYRLPSPSSVQTSLEKLEANQIIQHNTSGYFIYDHFFAQWLRSLS